MRLPSSDGVTIAVHDLGGSGEPLLISHATGFCGRAYEPLAALLANRFHVYALDYRGHGESTTPGPSGRLSGAPEADAMHWHRIADDLATTVAAISSEPIGVVGHSMGGACALFVEHRAPGTFRWAYVFEPIVMPYGFTNGERSSEIASGAARRRAVFADRGEAMLRYAERPPLSTLRADCLRAYVEHGFRDLPDGTVALRCEPTTEAAVFAGSGHITVDDVRDVDIPVTIATGAVLAEFSPAVLGETQAGAMRNARLERHEDLGHMGPLQDPPAIAARIIATGD